MAPGHRTKLGVFVRCSLAIALIAIVIAYVATTLPGTGLVAVAVASDRRDETPSFGSRWTDRPIRQLDRREITDLMRRGNELIIMGDLASARLVLQRAAEAGDPQAALILAGTYDPIMLAKVGIQGFARDIVEGFAPDTALARRWYEWAKELGSMEAARRLEMLPDPGSSSRAR
jgi:TPR repeat protein